MITKDDVMEKLKEVVDPEIGLNIVDLGLIYEVAIGQDNSVNIKMTLTTPGCPMHDSMALWAQRAVETLPKVGPVEVKIVWEPTWNPSMMSEEAKRYLGYAE
jgi:metal-sulfur cluster biosynthetic enzyme